MLATRTRIMAAICGLGAAFFLLFAPAAHAQTSTVTDALEGVTGQAADTLNQVTGGDVSVPNPVDEVKEATGDPIGQIVKKVVDVVDETTSDLGLGGPEPQEGGFPNEIGGTRTGSVPRTDGDDGGTTETRRAPAATPLTASASVGSASAAEALSPIPAAERGSTMGQTAQAALEATKQLVFPLLLAAIVGAFLVLHGRVGRGDPKLALAPVDADETYLVFQ